MAKKNKITAKTLIIIGGFFFLFLGLGAFVLHFQMTPTLYTPYPYNFARAEALEEVSSSTSSIGQMEKAQAEVEVKVEEDLVEADSEANIAIIGDRMAVRLRSFEEDLNKAISYDLEAPIKISFEGREGHGMHRTIQLLKKRQKFPKILVYLGASEEFHELKFNPESTPQILANFKKFSDPKLRTMISLIPFLSKYLYQKMEMITLPYRPSKTAHTWPTDPLFIQKTLETYLKLYESELERLIQLALEKDAQLILTTTPIRLDLAPKNNCAQNQDEEIATAQSLIQGILEEGDSKRGLELAKQLEEETPGNADTLYLKGRAATSLGLFPLARNSLLKAQAFDCHLWRTTPMHNIIIRRMADRYDLALIDFAQLVDMRFGRENIFIDEIFVKDRLYQDLSQKLGLKIRQFLHL